MFIAKFENGHETCTAVFCPPDNLNPKRGLELVREAFVRLCNQLPPPIVAARVEFRGEVLATFDAATIRAMENRAA